MECYRDVEKSYIKSDEVISITINQLNFVDEWFLNKFQSSIAYQKVFKTTVYVAIIEGPKLLSQPQIQSEIRRRINQNK